MMQSVVEHVYPARGAYEAVLEGCCTVEQLKTLSGSSVSSGVKLRNRVGYGWRVAARVALPAGAPPASPLLHEELFRSPLWATPPVLPARINFDNEFALRAFDARRARDPAACGPASPDACAVWYALAVDDAALGRNYTAARPPHSPLPAGITIEPHTGVVTVPSVRGPASGRGTSYPFTPRPAPPRSARRRQ